MGLNFKESFAPESFLKKLPAKLELPLDWVVKRVAGIFRITRYGDEQVPAYVRNPLPPQEKLECLDSFERFLHSKTPGVPPLIKAALAHVQF